jgi:DnaJ-class molecular chaperone
MSASYYETLRLREGAPPTAILQAYTELARRYHPDRHPNDPAAAARFRQIQQAFEMLYEPERHAIRGAFHTVASAFLTVRAHSPSRRRTEAATEQVGVGTATATVATIFWLVVVGACILIAVIGSLPAGGAGTSGNAIPASDTSSGQSSPEALLGGAVCLATFVYLLVMLLLLLHGATVR